MSQKNIYLLLFSFLLCINIDAQSNKGGTKLKQGITKYFKQEDDKFATTNRIVLFTKEQNVVGFYGWSAQGEDDSYFEGKLNGNIISGRKYSLIDGKASPITINVLPNSISTNSPIGKVIIPIDKDDLFTDVKIFTVYEQQSTSSKIIENEYELNNKGFSLVEIGKMENGNVWYKIKNNNIEGWVFGLLYAN
jgi:hypothetical protein